MTNSMADGFEQLPSPFRSHAHARIRRTHVADIREPLVRAIYYHRYAQRMREDAGPFSSDPEQRESHDFWMAEADRAQARCDAILADLRSARELDRIIQEEPATVRAKLSEVA